MTSVDIVRSGLEISSFWVELINTGSYGIVRKYVLRVRFIGLKMSIEVFLMFFLRMLLILLKKIAILNCILLVYL